MSFILIDKIEGNSGIGVPVFSKFGKNSNYNYKAFSPGAPFQAPESDNDHKTLTSDFDKFRYQRPTSDEERQIPQPKKEVTVSSTSSARKSHLLPPSSKQQQQRHAKTKQREHAVFQGVTREELFALEQRQGWTPPVGYYEPKYAALDKNVGGRTIGAGDGGVRERSLEIKRD